MNARHHSSDEFHCFRIEHVVYLIEICVSIIGDFPIVSNTESYLYESPKTYADFGIHCNIEYI